MIAQTVSQPVPLLLPAHYHFFDPIHTQILTHVVSRLPPQAAASGVLLPGMADGEQRTDAWHDLRDSRLTASAFSNALGYVLAQTRSTVS